MSILISYFIYIAIYLIELLLWDKSLNIIFDRKKISLSDKYMIMLCYAALAGHAHMRLNSCTGYSLLILIYLFYIIYCKKVFMCKINKALTCLCAFFSISITLEYLTICTYNLLCNKSVSMLSCGLDNIIVLVISKLLLGVIISLINKNSQKLRGLIKADYFIIWLALSSVLITTQYYLFASGYRNIPLIVFSMLFVLLAVALIVYSIICSIKNYRDEESLQEKIDFMSAQLRMTVNQNDIVFQMGKYLSSLDVLIRNDKLEAASEYINNLLRAWSNDGISNIENTLLAIIIYKYKMKAIQHKVDLNIQLDIRDITLSTESSNAIIGNMITNAIEASEKNIHPSERVIDFKIFTRDDKMIIECQNYYGAEPIFIDEKLVSNKMDKINHSYGLKTMYYYINKYNGTAYADFSGNKFIFKAEFERDMAIE